MPLIDTLVSRPDALILSHWRAIALLRHYGLSLPFQCVEKLGWSIDVNGRKLQFIFTPYLHFPGAFATFDSHTGVLFSSDLFGGYTEGWSLVARDESYFEAMRPFHEHYMPSRELLFHTLAKLDDLPIRIIAPQHGSIIPPHLVRTMIKGLKQIECGIYTLVQTNSRIEHLCRLNRMLHGFIESLILRRDFSAIAGDLIDQIGTVLPIARLCFFAQLGDGRVLRLDPETHFRGVVTPLPEGLAGAVGISKEKWLCRYGAPYCRVAVECTGEIGSFVLPLFPIDEQQLCGFAVLGFAPGVEVDDEFGMALAKLSLPLSVALEREIIYRSLDQERKKFYERSIRDPLTGLYTRLYMQETVQRFLSVHDRDANAEVAVAIFDLDHFKRINDRFGHQIGDEVLRAFADVLRADIRNSDVPVRLGGEEFAVFIIGSSAANAAKIAERIRARLAATDLSAVLDRLHLTVSAGVAWRRQGETLEQLLERADVALYRAKREGRDRICVAEFSGNG